MQRVGHPPRLRLGVHSRLTTQQEIMRLMSEYSIQPSVDQVQEFIEIAGDFSNPLDLVREAISNSVDAHAKSMTITFDVMKEYGENVLVITLQDDGRGMDSASIKSFFDLGNSTNRNNRMRSARRDTAPRCTSTAPRSRSKRSATALFFWRRWGSSLQEPV